ncbi:hypothetical protein LTR86_010388 [Recurvomyces mirabilis]|nr:hypothetical protein LTR86_010388 [Recurvomyces mirabilis]
MKTHFAFSVLALATYGASLCASHQSHRSGTQRSSSTPNSTTRYVVYDRRGALDEPVQTRLEISDLAANRPQQWTLFIRAMQELQRKNESDVTSYYRIAGVHGMPRQTWETSDQCANCGDADGYCTHDSVLFPAWHRVYVALFEQEMLRMATKIAKSFQNTTQRSAMLAARASLRLPYWDWAALPATGSFQTSSFLTSPSVSVEDSNGQLMLTSNPLYHYHFVDPSQLGYIPFTTWTHTLRYPTTNDVNATSQQNAAMSAFDSIRQNMQDRVYQLLSGCHDYLSFSNDQASSRSPQCPTTYPEFSSSNSSKDTIAYHINQLYGPNTNAKADVFSKRVGHERPARRMTELARDTTEGSRAKGLMREEARYVSTMTPTKCHGKTCEALAKDSHTKHLYNAYNGSRYDYLCKVDTPRYALNGSYDVYVFAREPTTRNFAALIHDDALIGVVGIPAGGGGENFHTLVSSSIPLTRTLQELVSSQNQTLLDMGETYCIPFLANHLTWRVVKDGQEVDTRVLPGFQISVYSTTSTPPTTGSLPRWSTLKYLPQVTEGKDRGSQSTNA